ncbi:MAG: SUMF1/EgtB/PvdO family nonheme iron enzyme [Planctomycetota bacterium]
MRRACALGAAWALGVLAASCGGPDAPVADAGGRDAAARLGSHELVAIPAGTLEIDGRTVHVEAFELDRYEVDNDAFAAFVEATGYVTEAERIGNSVVFVHDWDALSAHPFRIVEGADWRHPSGPESDLVGRGDHPVVNVSWRDASEYALWRGLRLPTFEEWTHAAAGGLSAPEFPWGEELTPGGQHVMNAWQGVFPVEDLGLDGYRGTAPVGTFPPNGYGLFDVAGNVWEWTATTLRTGRARGDVVALAAGGSFLCREEAAEGYHACGAYRIGRREAKPREDGNNQVGFRCAR